MDAALRLAVGTPARKDLGVRRAFTRTCAAKWGQWKALAAELPPCPERAIIGGADDTAQSKMDALRACGLVVAESPAELGSAMAARLKL